MQRSIGCMLCLALICTAPVFAWNVTEERTVGVDGAGGVAYFLFRMLHSRDPFIQDYWMRHPDIRKEAEKTCQGAIRWEIREDPKKAYFALPFLAAMDPEEIALPDLPDDVTAGQLKILNAVKQTEDYVLTPCYRWQEGGKFGRRYTQTMRQHTATGQVFLKRYQDTGREEFLDIAVGTANWLLKWAREAPVTYHVPGTAKRAVMWHEYVYLDERGQRIDADPAQSNRCRGAAYVASFLFSIWQAVKDRPGDVPGGHGTYQDYASAYLEAAEAACNWIAGNAEPCGKGWRWPMIRVIRRGSLKGEARKEYFTEYGRGAPGIADLFLNAYHATGNGAYLLVTRRAAAWLMDCVQIATVTIHGAPREICYWEAFQKSDGTWVPEVKTSPCQGVEAIGTFFLRAWLEASRKDSPLADRKADYRRMAEGAAWWLASQAEEDRGGIRWPFFKPTFGAPFYPTGYYTNGCAGSGDCARRFGEHLRNDALRALSIGAVKWLLATRVKEPSGYSWPYNIDLDPNARKRETNYYSKEGVAVLQRYRAAHPRREKTPE